MNSLLWMVHKVLSKNKSDIIDPCDLDFWPLRPSSPVKYEVFVVSDS